MLLKHILQVIVIKYHESITQKVDIYCMNSAAHEG